MRIVCQADKLHEVSINSQKVAFGNGEHMKEQKSETRFYKSLHKYSSEVCETVHTP